MEAESESWYQIRHFAKINRIPLSTGSLPPANEVD